MRILSPARKFRGIYFENQRVLQFKKSDELISEDDIFNLFLGFVRLIKRSVEIEVENRYESKINSLEKELERIKEISK